MRNSTSFPAATLGLIISLICHVPGFSQEIKWNTAPRKGFVYEISNKEALKLLTGGATQAKFKSLLHSQVDTFDVSQGWTRRPAKGHFILAKIVENTVECEYTSVFPYQVFLLREYNALSLQVLDLEGNVREDAKVKLGIRRLHIDHGSKTYRLEDGWVTGNDRLVTVLLNGFQSVFEVQKHDVPSWASSYNNDDSGPDFYSYMISDKNKYKPNERVRFKSYALNGRRTPVREPLNIMLQSGNYGNFVKMGTVSPHRPGSFAGEFQLHDSLKLVLDRDHYFQLQDKRGRIVASCSFHYEDYELTGNRLQVTLSTARHFYPEKNQITITATDVNGLSLKDARADVLIRTKTVGETFQPLLVLPDTLQYTRIDLDANGPTVLDILPALFQKSNTTYEVVVTVLNSQNQRMEQTKGAAFFYSAYELTSRLSGDSICYGLLKNGIPQSNASVMLSHNGDQEAKSVLLPYCEKLNPAHTSIRLESMVASKNISVSHLNPSLGFNGGIKKDSFQIILYNPHKLDVSWFIYQGSTLLQKGFGKEFEYGALIENRTETYYAELLYSLGGEDHAIQQQYEFNETFLDVSLEVPDRIYPGQKIDAIIHVQDQQGAPLEDVDLTALAYTAKLNYYLPDLPYYGTTSAARDEKADYSKHDKDRPKTVLELDYHKWRAIAGLDTMKYYQFIYPATVGFKFTFIISDSTQFAPYVVQRGNARQIFVIEVNRQPVYFSWTSQPKQYSFYIAPSVKKLITLRLSDRVIVLDSMIFEPGKKTIFSIDLDHLPKGARVFNLSPEPSTFEVERYTPLIAQFEVTKGKSYLDSRFGFTPLTTEWRPQFRVLAGPVIPAKLTFVNDALKTTYQHAGGFTYSFEDNIVYKQNAIDLVPKKFNELREPPMLTVNGLAITKKLFLTQPEQSKPRWLSRNIDIAADNARITTVLPFETAQSGIAGLLFENCLTATTFPSCVGSRSNGMYYKIPVGLHNVIVLYNNGTYYKTDSVDLRPYRTFVVDMDYGLLHAADPGSRRLLLEFPNSCASPPAARRSSEFSSYYYYSGAGNIQGRVLDETYVPIPGASILIKGTPIGTASDVDGNFSLGTDESRITLVISFIGYVTREVEVARGSNVTVYLSPDIQQLQEVVVTGYGGTTSQSITGSVSSLSGMVSGVQVGQPPFRNDVESTEQEKKEKQVIQEAEQRLYSELLTLSTIRSNFSDVGFWEPRLFTDKKGMATFSVTFPDDITRWETVVYAMNRRLQTGTYRKAIRSYKPLMAELNVPQFLTRGDSASFLGKVLNYTQDKTVAGKITWSGAGSDFEKAVELTGFRTDKLPVFAATTDSIRTKYTFTRDDGYLDGEERIVPVVEQGVLRAEGTLSILNNEEQRHIKAFGNETRIVEILDSPIDVYSGDVSYLLNYRYDCNEQLASKLIGLVNSRALAQFEGKKFRYDKTVNKIITRLLTSQNQEFLWSWWGVSAGTSYWMSAHILRALKLAKDAGYAVNLDVANIARKAEYNFEFRHRYSEQDADIVNALAAWGAEFDFKKHIPILDSMVRKAERETNARYGNSFYRYSFLKYKMELLEARQLTGMPYRRDSLLSYKKEGMLGDVYFSDGKPANFWYDDEMMANVIAYRIVKNDSVLRDIKARMQLYFLSQHKEGVWNTYQCANVIMTVLPDLLAEGYKKGNTGTVKLTGKEDRMVSAFPFRLRVNPGEELFVSKETGQPLYFMEYVEERTTIAKTGVAGFGITTTLGKDSLYLEAGNPVTLTVDVVVKKDKAVQNVMIDVPVPGACSYADKRQPFEYNSVEVHREYFKEHTSIFCETMKPGKYRFTIQLLPRFTGKYILNPAQVSLMYVPVVNANTAMKRVEVR